MLRNMLFAGHRPAQRIFKYRCLAKHRLLPLKISSSLFKRTITAGLTHNMREIDLLRVESNGHYYQETMTVKDLLHATNLQARDLLPLEGMVGMASIQPRRSSIVVGVSHQRAIITSREMFLLYPESFAVRHFAKEFKQTLTEIQASNFDTTPDFELLALEGVLSNIAHKYTRRIGCFGPMITSLLEELRGTEYKSLGNATGNVGSSIASRILPLRNTLSSYERSSEGLMRCIERVMNDDADMAMMMLSRREKEHPSGDLNEVIDVSQHEPVELILEAYYHRVEECVQSAFGLRKNIEATQELLNIALDDNRNRLIQTNVHMAIITVSLAFSTMCYGLFGMNLVSGLEQHPTMFWKITAAGLGTSLCVYGGINSFMTGSMFSFRQNRKDRLAKTLMRQNAIKHISGLMPAASTTNGEGALLADVNEALLCYLEDAGGSDATLDPHGMLSILEASSGSMRTLEDVQIIFDAFDSNGDGLLNYDDVVNFVSSQYETSR